MCREWFPLHQEKEVPIFLVIDLLSTRQCHHLLRWQWPLPPILPAQFGETLFDVEIEVSGEAPEGLRGAYPIEESPPTMEGICPTVVLWWVQVVAPRGEPREVQARLPGLREQSSRPVKMALLGEQAYH